MPDDRQLVNEYQDVRITTGPMSEDELLQFVARLIFIVQHPMSRHDFLETK